MRPRALAVLLCLLVSPLAVADQQTTATARTDDAGAARAKLEATHRQAKAEDANVKQLKARVDTLESHSDAAARALAERDRKIAELEKELAASRKP
ncbi:MAG: hypothetical protein ABWZ54_04300 [Luteibacter sp.]